MARLPLDVRNSLKRQVPRVIKNDLKKEFKPKFEKLKTEMIREFLSHPVTVEILNGPNASNTSGTLNGVTNLFAFIGFEAGQDPIKPILEILTNIDYTDSGPTTKEIGRSFSVNIPEPQDIFLVTPMPWATGRSWAQGIETGISGIGYLLNKSNRSSRSGVAIQADRKVRSGRFNNAPYISSLIRKYKKKFEELK